MKCVPPSGTKRRLDRQKSIEVLEESHFAEPVVHIAFFMLVSSLAYSSMLKI
jgi:hypothetical protein